MSNKIRIGFIGCGNIARNKHAKGLARITDVEMVGFYDYFKASAESLCNDYGCENARVYDSAKDLLNDESIDTVHICTPNNSHAELTLMALHAGKNVMVEKPFAIKSADAQAMVNLAEEKNLKLTVGHQNRFREDSMNMYKAVQSGSLGDVYFARAHAIRRRGVPSWGQFLDKEIQGGGPLIDIGCHALDLTLWLMDNYKPKMVVGNTYQLLGKQKGLTNSWAPWDPDKFEVEDSAFGFVTMENGATLTLDTSWALNCLQTSNITTTLCGTKGGADMLDGLRINTDTDGYLSTSYPLESKDYEFKSKDPLTPGDREMASWINALKTNTDPVVKPQQTLVVTQIIEALYESASTGKPVYFN